MKPNLHKFFLLLYLLSMSLFSQSAIAGNDPWYWPVPTSRTITSGRMCNSGHPGVDIQAYQGATIIASRPGKVVVASGTPDGKWGEYCEVSAVSRTKTDGMGLLRFRYNVESHDNNSGSYWAIGGGGKIVVIDHYDGTFSEYAHMSDILVSTGATVTAGQPIGKMGMSGCATGVHLHFTIKSQPGWQNNSPGYIHCDFLNNNIAQFPDYVPNPTGTLDIKGILDGKSSENLSGYGTAKVYINGSLASDGNNVSDYYKQLNAGTTYRVVATPNDGYSLDGDTYEYSGTITANQVSTVQFTLNSVWLKVNGVLDGQTSDTLNGYGTFDVVNLGSSGNDHVVIADDVSSFNQRMKVGTYFEISDIKARDGFEYKGMTNSNGSVYPTGRFLQGGTTTITLAFDSKPVEGSCEWQERPFIPNNVNSDEWEIDVKNHYSQVSTTSPGSGWTQTGSSIRYVVSGEPYTTYKDLGETSTRKFVENVWYHWCGYAGHSDWVELENAAGYSVYHENAIGSGLEDRAQYKDSNFSTTGVYQHELWWTSGQYAGHLANCGLGGQRWYYGWKYQNYTAITDYTWERDSEWLSLDQADSSATSISYRFRLKGCDAVSYKVTFKVVNGSWDDGATADKTVTLEGIAADTLTLTEAQIPTAGTKPAANYKAGEWGVTPSTDTQITGDTTYTYTYAKKNSISSTVTFKVVNGSWDDGTAANKTVTLNGYEGDTLKLKAADIPAVGNKPAANYNSGSWDTAPSVDTAITGNKTFTYTYKAKSEVTRTVTFKVVNGSWDDGTTADKTVTLNGFEGDTLTLTTAQIPAVGSKPNETYKAGSWDTAPDTTTAITSNKSYTYTYAVDENDNRIKLIVSSESARPGEEVTVGVSIENNAGARAIYFVVSYDESKLLYEGFVNSGLEPWIRQGVGKGLLWQGSQDTNFNGEMVKLKFSVLEEFDEGETIVTLTDPDITDKDENDFSYVIESGKVTVIKYLKGDINGDGKVSVKDLVRLQSYILDKSVVVFGNPDTNGDEKVSVKDLVRLQKYILDKSVEIF